MYYDKRELMHYLEENKPELSSGGSRSFMTLLGWVSISVQNIYIYINSTALRIIISTLFQSCCICEVLIKYM